MMKPNLYKAYKITIIIMQNHFCITLIPIKEDKHFDQQNKSRV